MEIQRHVEYNDRLSDTQVLANDRAAARPQDVAISFSATIPGVEGVRGQGSKSQ